MKIREDNCPYCDYDKINTLSGVPIPNTLDQLDLGFIQFHIECPNCGKEFGVIYDLVFAGLDLLVMDQNSGNYENVFHEKTE